MMNDIPNKGSNPSIPQQQTKVEQVKQETTPVIETAAPVQANSAQESKDLPKVDTKGQSLVAPADNLENDIKMLQEHPKVAFTSLKYFDNAYNALKAEGNLNAYEEASAQMGALANELI